METRSCLPFTKKFPEKFGWKVNGSRLHGSFQRKISRRNNGTSGKVVLFVQTEFSKGKLVYHFFKAIFDTSFRPLRPFLGKWICTNGKRHSGTKYQSWVLLTIYPNRISTWLPKWKTTLILIQHLLFCYVNHVALMLTSVFKHNFHEKRSVSKQGQTQPSVQPKARIINSQL